MRCCVRSCSSRKKKDDNTKISFHIFPKDPIHRTAWLEGLGMTDWEPGDRSVVCSEHFKDDDYTMTKASLRRLNIDAIPHNIHIDLEAPAIMRICKICLTLDTKLCHIRLLKLDRMYKDVIGASIVDDEFHGNLPVQVCWECASRLKNAASLKNKALLADMLLRDLLKAGQCVKVHDIISIHKKYSNFGSSLGTQQTFHSDDADDPNIVKIETDDNDFTLTEVKIKEEVHEMIPEYEVELVPAQVEDRNPLDLDDHDNDDNKVGCLEVFTHNKEKANVQETVDDEDKSLSVEVSIKVEDDVGEFSGDAGEAEMAELNEKEDVEKVPSEGEKEENSDVIVKRLRKIPLAKPLDERVMAIRNLSHDQMIQDVLKRKDSTRYKYAKFKCTVCYQAFSTQEKLISHDLKHSESCGPYECNICKIRLKDKFALWRHKRRHAVEYNCKLCPFATRARYNALCHLKFHDGRKFECPRCDIMFEKRTTLLTHLRLKHISDAVCELCGYTFVSKTGVLVHKRLKHPLVKKKITLEGPYCKKCDVTFLSQEAHDTHLRLSSKHIKNDQDSSLTSNDPEVKGSIGHQFSPRLMRPTIHAQDPNQKLWQRNEPLDCEQCGLNLPNIRVYARHFKVAHPGIIRTKYKRTPFMCEQCGKIFENFSYLISHQWKHTGNKSFQCDYCNKLFSQKPNLAMHIKNTHVSIEERRSYDCQECGKSFASDTNMKRHMLIHTGLKPHKCHSCEKCFTNPGELRSHVDHVHLMKPWPKKVRVQKTNVPQLEC